MSYQNGCHLKSIAHWPLALADVRLNGCDSLQFIPSQWPSKLRRIELQDYCNLQSIPDFDQNYLLLDYVNLAHTKQNT